MGLGPERTKMPKGGSRRTARKDVLLIIALCASFVFILAIILNWGRWAPLGYELAGSAKKASDQLLPK